MPNSKQYDEFVDKFKPRHTTDDCFTPPNVYAAVLDWASQKYGFDRSRVVRPFCPGGDYEHFDYAPDAVVVDNPPFSIVSKIVRFYNDRNIRYFLFCPGLTAFGLIRDKRSTVISVGVNVCFDNTANILVAFVTNLAGEILFETSPDLHDKLECVNRQNLKAAKNNVTKYRHPIETITAAGLQYLAIHHTSFKVRKDEALFIRKVDCGVNFFGGAFLLSERAAAERAAAERAAAERAAAHVITISPREKQIQKSLG